jgi:PilZ domain
MEANRRKGARRAIGYNAKIVANDRSWDRDCRVLDVSQTGAKLAVAQASDIPLDFILALSMDGKATRQCHVMWVKDSEIGVVFERREQPRSIV